MKELKLGILGLSEGNGHPYSWSAIFNGYEREAMAKCPFPVIPEYLFRQEFPRDAIADARVTHIWTQERSLSGQVAEAARIDTVVGNYEEMIGQVDAILLARDDAENHLEMAKPFIEAGLPVYIDKPLASTVAQAQQIYALERFDNQIFTCSALAYAREFELADTDLGRLSRVEAKIGNVWSRYAVHVIEPVLRMVGDQGSIAVINTTVSDDAHTAAVSWESGLETLFTTTGSIPTAPRIDLTFDTGTKSLLFADTFGAFRNALQHFVDVVRKERVSVPREFVLKVIRIIEEGGTVG
jgi:predicted dehydrogenase